MTQRIGLLFCALALFGLAQAQALTPRQALERLFTEELDATWFSEAFVQQVPPAQLGAILAQLEGQLGSYQQVEGEASPFTVVFESGTATVQLTLDDQGRITGLLFTAVTPAVDPDLAKAALARLFTEPLDEAWFTPDFLAAVPPAQLRAGLAGITAQLGPFEGAEGEANPFTVIFARGTAEATISLGADGAISGLLITNLAPHLNLEEAVAALAALPGEVSVLVSRNGQPLVTLNDEQPLAVGSSFKLTVLAALRAQVEAGVLAWDDTYPLDPAWKSLPSGILQDTPDFSEHALARYAELMIAISDNTATDALIHILGREQIEALSPRNRPFLTTREAFVLKNPANADLLARYRQGDEAERRAALAAAAARPLPGPELFASGPVALDVEWFYSTRELCEVMAEVYDLPMMQLNPGVASPADWERIAFKGGSEPGVMNLTTWLEADGERYCVSVTQNRSDAALDEAQLVSLYGSLVRALASRP